MRTDDVDRVELTIESFTGQYAFLSNFYPDGSRGDGESYPIVWLGYRVPTAEHAYQLTKTMDQSDRARIAAAPMPGQAKKIGRKVELREDWEDIRVEVMTLIVWQKFSSHRELSNRLLATTPAMLVEGNTWGDKFWGV